MNQTHSTAAARHRLSSHSRQSLGRLTRFRSIASFGFAWLLLLTSGTFAPLGAQPNAEAPAVSDNLAAPAASSMERSEPLPPPDPNEEPVGYFNLSLGTMGGKQFWTDYVVRGGWRIQQNALSGHYRLLNPDDTRQAWGNYAHCWQLLNERFPTDPQAAERPHVVILLHGLTRSRSNWEALAEQLEKAGFRVVCFGYASTRGTLSEHATALDHTIRQLERVETVSFVGHSLGNLVVRRYLSEHPDPLLGEPKRLRMVMMGPPNLGAQMARRFRDNPLFTMVWGKSGEQLAEHWQELEPGLATPDFEFGILAGGGDLTVSNPLVEGDDDLIVSVEETRLPGACDFRRVGVAHSFMPWDNETLQLTEKFLRDGCFETPATRQPINAAEQGTSQQ